MVLVISICISFVGKETVVSEDEECNRVNFDKVKTLKPAFLKDGICLLILLTFKYETTPPYMFAQE